MFDVQEWGVERLTIDKITTFVNLERQSWFLLYQQPRYDACRGHTNNLFCFPPTRPGVILNDSFSNNFHMPSLISHSEVIMVEAVSYPSVLAGTAAAHLQDVLSSRKIFASHRTQIYSPCDCLCMNEKCTLNKSSSGTVLRKERSWSPMVLVSDNI